MKSNLRSVLIVAVLGAASLFLPGCWLAEQVNQAELTRLEEINAEARDQLDLVTERTNRLEADLQGAVETLELFEADGLRAPDWVFSSVQEAKAALEKLAGLTEGLQGTVERTAVAIDQIRAQPDTNNAEALGELAEAMGIPIVATVLGGLGVYLRQRKEREEVASIIAGNTSETINPSQLPKAVARRVAEKRAGVTS